MTWKALRFLLAAIKFVLAPVVDSWRGISMTRLLAASCLLLALREQAAHGLTANVVWLMALAIAAAFGKATFTAIASRGSWTGTTTDTTARVITEQITTRRAASDVDGAEPAP